MAPKEARRMKRKNQPERHSLEGLEKIRKLERDTILCFKRYDTIINVDKHIEEASGNPIALQEMLKNIAVMASDLSSGQLCFQYAATAKLSFLLSIENPPIHEVIERGCVPRLVEFLGEQHVSHPNLRLGAARALSQIIYCGTLEHAKVVVEDGAVPKFVELLTSENDDLQELAVLALGSVATKSIGYRDLVLGHGALTQLQYLLEKYSEPSMLRSSTLMLQNASRTLAILCNGSPPPTFDQVKSALPTLQKLIHLHPPVGVLGDVCRDACLALSCLSNGTVEQIQVFIDANICERLVTLMRCPELQVVEPAVRIVGNIFRGSDSQIEVLIDHGVFTSLHHVLTQHVRSSILRKTCWAISNMTIGNRRKIQKVIAADIIPPLVNLLQDEQYEAEVKWEAVCALSNATLRGSKEHIKYLVNHDCIAYFCEHLLCPDSRTQRLCLVGLKNVLKVGEAEKGNGINLYAKMIKELDGFSKIENLKTSPDTGEMATNILRSYWRRQG